MGGSISNGSPAVDNTTIEIDGSSQLAIKDGGVGTDQLAPELVGWEVAATGTFAGTTLTISSIPVFDEYMIQTNLSNAQVNDTLLLRFNGDTGNNYQQFWIQGTTVSTAASQVWINAGGLSNTSKSSLMAFFPGKCDSSGGLVQVSFMPCGILNHRVGLMGAWNGGADTQINSVTFVTTSATAGPVVVFGRNLDEL